MNERIITVKGIGNVAAKPDLVVINMNLATTTPDYAKSMEYATIEIDALRQSLVSIDYEREALKTTNFNISTENESYKDAAGNWRQKFKGYKISHALKLEFDFDMKRLGETLTAISTCGANPDFKIAFSVKDKNTISAQLLENAIFNATERAKILARAAGVTLGAIQKIDYNWSELRFVSDTSYHDIMACASDAPTIDIEPEDIKIDDSVTVVWEIE